MYHLIKLKKKKKHLNTKKACQDTDIPTKIVQENSDIFANIKDANITPVHKKDYTNI